MIIKQKSIREQVYESLKEAIVNGEIESGEKIIELEYAEKNTSTVPPPMYSSQKGILSPISPNSKPKTPNNAKIVKKLGRKKPAFSPPKGT